MPGDFQTLEDAFRSDGAPAVFDHVLRHARETGDHRLLFRTRLMQVRHKLGLPLIETESVPDVSEALRPEYEAAFRGAAREAGELCLGAGDIAGAWPYFQALGEPAPVAAAIEQFSGGDQTDRIIEIAFQEGVNPRKGFELLLERHGICRAITWFGGNRGFEGRDACLLLLVRSLHAEILSGIKEAIAAAEGAAPETSSLATLMSGRDWLFEGNTYYVDSTHLASILQFSPEIEDPESLRMALDLAEYGQHLGPMFHFRSEPPFDDIYRDYAVYLRAMLGEDVDAAVAHFRRKANVPGDIAPAEVFIDLLLRLDRFQDAVAASLEFFPDANNPPRGCPSVVQLCQIARDYTTLRKIARERQDLLGFAAGLIQAGQSYRTP